MHIDEIEKKQADLQAKLKDLEVPIPDPPSGRTYEKWDILDKQLTLEEKREEVNQVDFTKEADVK